MIDSNLWHNNIAMNLGLKSVFTILFVSCFFLFGLSFDELGFRFFSIIVLAFTTLAILSLPTKVSVMIALIFISFQGFFKVISNYHPIVHVGADVVIITLILKILFLTATKHFPKTIKNPPLTTLFAVHFSWILILFFNPYSLSFISSVAGSKIYISMFLLYFFGYYLAHNKKDVHHFFILFIILTMIHNIFAIYQGFMGPTSVTSIHPRYAIQLAKYLDTAFRPFGLTNLPGAPAVYVYTSLPFFVYFIYIGKNILMKFFLFSWLPLSGMTLMFCQVRSALIKALISLAFFVIALLTSQLKLGVATRTKYILATAFASLVILFTMPQFMDLSVQANSENEKAFDRSLSTFDVDSISNARRDAWERFSIYLKTVPFGAGFSRVGASAGAFIDANEADPFFSKDYFFADNLFITLVIELGIPGLIILSLLIFLILLKGLQFWRRESRQDIIPLQIAILSSLIAITIGSLGAEGIIYNPESSFFWLFSGILMRTNLPEFNQG